MAGINNVAPALTIVPNKVTYKLNAVDKNKATVYEYKQAFIEFFCRHSIAYMREENVC